MNEQDDLTLRRFLKRYDPAASWNSFSVKGIEESIWAGIDASVPAYTSVRNGWFTALFENNWIASAGVTASLLFLILGFMAGREVNTDTAMAQTDHVSFLALADDTQGQSLPVTNAAWEESDDNE
jgi:hypothetical protein